MCFGFPRITPVSIIMFIMVPFCQIRHDVINRYVCICTVWKRMFREIQYKNFGFNISRQILQNKYLFSRIFRIFCKQSFYKKWQRLYATTIHFHYFRLLRFIYGLQRLHGWYPALIASSLLENETLFVSLICDTLEQLDLWNFMVLEFPMYAADVVSEFWGTCVACCCTWPCCWVSVFVVVCPALLSDPVNSGPELSPVA